VFQHAEYVFLMQQHKGSRIIAVACLVDSRLWRLLATVLQYTCGFGYLRSPSVETSSPCAEYDSCRRESGSVSVCIVSRFPLPLPCKASCKR